jgi:hypothetical protein
VREDANDFDCIDDWNNETMQARPRDHQKTPVADDLRLAKWAPAALKTVRPMQGIAANPDKLLLYLPTAPNHG